MAALRRLTDRVGWNGDKDGRGGGELEVAVNAQRERERKRERLRIESGGGGGHAGTRGWRRVDRVAGSKSVG